MSRFSNGAGFSLLKVIVSGVSLVVDSDRLLGFPETVYAFLKQLIRQVVGGGQR